MLSNLPKVAIIYLSFHCEPYMDDVVSALKKLSYPKDRVAFVIVDNPHPQYGSSVRYIEETVMPLSGVELPQVVILPQKENLGFAGGNNVGIQWAINNRYDYVYFHNNDGFVAADSLEPLIAAMENDKTIGIAQPMILLYPETNLINTDGNSFHYLGLAFCGNLRKPKESVKHQPVEEIGYASGAAQLMRVDLLKQYGAWDHDFFLYHEDLEYSLRVRALGYKIVLVPDSVFYHKYSFSRNKEKFYYIERNRFGVMLMYFKWLTLLLLLPIAGVLEAGLILFAWKKGWLREKLSAYEYWFDLKNIKLWLFKRQRIQAMRKVGDKALLSKAVSTVVFEEKSIDNPLLRYIGNPLMAVYWWVARRLIFW